MIFIIAQIIFPSNSVGRKFTEPVVFQIIAIFWNSFLNYIDLHLQKFTTKIFSDHISRCPLSWSVGWDVSCIWDELVAELMEKNCNQLTIFFVNRFKLGEVFMNSLTDARQIAPLILNWLAFPLFQSDNIFLKMRPFVCQIYRKKWFRVIRHLNSGVVNPNVVLWRPQN